MKLRIISVLIVVITISNAFGQWNQEFQINNFDSSRVAGWLPLKKLGDKWEYRFYILDHYCLVVYYFMKNA